MKRILLYTTLLSLFLASCTGSGNEVAEKKKLLADKKASVEKLGTEITKLQDEIAKLEPNAPAEAKIKYVKAEDIKPSTFVHYLQLQGLVETNNNVMVTSRNMGTVSKVYVTEGATVKKGQILAQLDNSVLSQTVQELKSSLDLVTTLYNKQKALWDQKIGTEVQYLTAKNQKENLEAKLNTLQSQNDLNRVTSPISGSVDAVNVKVGEAAQPGMGLFRVVSLEGLKVTAKLADVYTSRVKLADMVEIILPDNQSIKAKITFVSKVVDPISRTFEVEVAIPSDQARFRPNMLCTIKVQDQVQTNKLVVEENLVQNTEAGTIIYIIGDDNGKKVAKAKVVKLGESYAGKVVIESGLQAGDKIITFGFQDLVDGTPISL